MSQERLNDLMLEASFDAAHAYRIVLGELIVELVHSGQLRRTQALKVLLRAQGFSEASDEEIGNPDESLLTQANRSMREHVVKRLGARSDISLLRRRAQKIRAAHDRRRRRT